MKWFRKILWLFGILLLTALTVAAHYYYKAYYRPAHSQIRLFHSQPDNGELTRIQEKAALQRNFLSRHGYNTQICFLVDMTLPSGRSRFFVYDLHRDSILLSGLVAHGCGSGRFSYRPTFSNVNGSGCTSLGRYRIGYPYAGSFGRAYKLYGLDSTNDQAFARNVVLHSYEGVPATETDPYPICNSRGCPMVSRIFLEKLQPLIDHSGKPIMLWIFD